MNGATDLPDIVRSFAHAGSFWRETVPLFAASLALLGAALALLVFRWRRTGGAARLRSLAAGEAGAAEAMDFVLTFPIVMLVAFLLVQLLMGAHASLVVHYAAYSAARRELPDRDLRRRARLAGELNVARWLLHGVSTDDPEVVADAVQMLADLDASVADAEW